MVAGAEIPAFGLGGFYVAVRSFEAPPPGVDRLFFAIFFNTLYLAVVTLLVVLALSSRGAGQPLRRACAPPGYLAIRSAEISWAIDLKVVFSSEPVAGKKTFSALLAQYCSMLLASASLTSKPTV